MVISKVTNESFRQSLGTERGRTECTGKTVVSRTGRVFPHLAFDGGVGFPWAAGRPQRQGRVEGIVSSYFAITIQRTPSPVVANSQRR